MKINAEANQKAVTLTKVKIENFKSFSSLEASIKPGITLLTGRNGSGKSSFIEAVKTAFTNSSVSASQIKNGQFRTFIQVVANGVSHEHVTQPKTDANGKITGTIGERKIDGIDRGVSEFGTSAVWSGVGSYLYDLDAARDGKTAQKAAFKLAGVVPFNEWFHSQTGVSADLMNEFANAKGNPDDTLKSLRIKIAEAKKDADRAKIAAETLQANCKQVPSYIYMDDATSARKAELIAMRNQLTAQLQGARESDYTRKAVSDAKAAEANKLILQAAEKRNEARRLVTEANAKEAARVQAINAEKQAKVNEAMEEKKKLQEQVSTLYTKGFDAKQKYDALLRERLDLTDLCDSLRQKWMYNNVTGVCPLTGQACQTAAQAKASEIEAKLAQIAADGKAAKEELDAIEQKIDAASKELIDARTAYMAAKAKLDAFVIPTVTYHQARLIQPGDVTEAVKLNTEADALVEQANSMERPTFTPSAEVAQIGAQLSSIATELASIDAKEKEISAHNAQVDTVKQLNAENERKVASEQKRRLAQEEIAAVYGSYADEFTGLIAKYMKQASDAVNGLFVNASSYLPGLRIKLFKENMQNELGKVCFIPQLVKADGSVSESLSDGETQLYAIALITSVYQPITGVRMPILVDRAEAIDRDRLEAALAGQQAIVAARTDSDFEIR